MFLKGTKKLPVAMRLGETPVHIPNTMVKTQAAHGTYIFILIYLFLSGLKWTRTTDLALIRRAL